MAENRITTRTKTIKTYSPIVLGTLLCISSLQAAAVKLSFLGDEAVLQDTFSFLSKSGCDTEGIATFRHAVQNYFTTEFDIDLSKFPKPRQGFYSFASMPKLVAALPAGALETKHPWGMNCFDLVICLARTQLKVNLRPDEISGTLLVPLLNTNTQPAMFVPTGAATPRDAFNRIYPADYREDTKRFFSQTQSDSRICLTAALYRCRWLPTSIPKEKFADSAMQVLMLDWRRDGLTFPGGFELVLVHGEKLHEMYTEHAGLLFSRGEGYTYIEKRGIKGPFVRLDFMEKSELMMWLAAVWKNCELHDAHLVTINDSKIDILEPSK